MCSEEVVIERKKRKKQGRFPLFLLSMTYVGSKTAGEKKEMGDDRYEQKNNEQKTRQGKKNEQDMKRNGLKERGWRR